MDLAPPEARGRSAILWDLAAVAVVLAIAAALYVRALAVPWYLDDAGAILGNPAIRSLPLALAGIAGSRGVAYLSFALNYAVLGPGPAGFHAVNVGIHLATCLAVYALLRRFLPGSPLLRFGGALLFAVHPLQTQAVIYVVQRMASLAALFFFLAFLLFFRARDRAAQGARFRSPKHLTPYLASLLFAALAALTKQNTLIFPVVFLIADRLFGPERAERRPVPYFAPFFLLALALGLKELLNVYSGSRFVRAYDWFHVGTGGPGALVQEVTALRYFVTELSVLWKYLRLLVVPWGQAVDHGYPVISSYLTLQNIAAALGLAALIGVATLAWRRLPCLSFGITFFLLGLSVESTVFPLDTMEEHRLYLPMFGFVLGMLEGLRRLPRKSVQAIAIAAAIVPMSALTWHRNNLWTSPVAFFQDAIRVHPENARLWTWLGDVFLARGERLPARAALEKALELRPQNPVAMVSLAEVYADDGRIPDGEEMCRHALELVPTYPAAHRMLGKILLRQGRSVDALAEFQDAVRLNPADGYSLFFEALLANKLGDRDLAARAARQLEAIDPERAARVKAAVGLQP